MARDMGSKDDVYPIEGGNGYQSIFWVYQLRLWFTVPAISRAVEFVFCKRHVVAHNIVGCPAQFMG
jgi:hypothetical protein